MTSFTATNFNTGVATQQIQHYHRFNHFNPDFKEENGYRYIETKGGEETILLLHGLFGSLSNFTGLMNSFGKKYNVVAPVLPVLELPLFKVSVSAIAEYVNGFIQHKGFSKTHLVGNSLGGHVALVYALENPSKVKSLTLTGSSGLFESAFGSTFPKRGDYEYIRKKTQDIFYDANFATKGLVDEVYFAVNDRGKAIRIVAAAKSAIRDNLRDKLGRLNLPTLLIWGKQDTVTPLFVGQEFNKLIKNSKLVVLDRCGHAPMMERSDEFNAQFEQFINVVKTGN